MRLKDIQMMEEEEAEIGSKHQTNPSLFTLPQAPIYSHNPVSEVA
jgi:hypothetical protein